MHSTSSRSHRLDRKRAGRWSRPARATVEYDPARVGQTRLATCRGRWRVASGARDTACEGKRIPHTFRATLLCLRSVFLVATGRIVGRTALRHTARKLAPQPRTSRDTVVAGRSRLVRIERRGPAARRPGPTADVGIIGCRCAARRHRDRPRHDHVQREHLDPHAPSLRPACPKTAGETSASTCSGGLHRRGWRRVATSYRLLPLLRAATREGAREPR
jgi:hypothetical protein